MVSANDINRDDTVSLINNNLKTTSSNIYDDIGENRYRDKDKFTIPADSSDIVDNGEIVKSSANNLCFRDLNQTINSGNSSIVLDADYVFNPSTDSDFITLGGIIAERDLTIDGNGHYIDCGNQIRFLSSSSFSITLQNINIINGNVSKFGGAVYIFKANGSFINSTFTGNYGEYGGAVYIYSGSGTFIDSSFVNNNGTYGGAVYLTNSSGTFIHSSFSGNNGEFGGAVYDYGSDCSLVNSSFSGNMGNYGGVIYVYGSNCSLVNSSFSNNVGDRGGVVYIHRSTGSFVNSTFTRNNGIAGGALCIEDANCSLINSLFSDNNAIRYGGAVFLQSSVGSFINSSFFANNAVVGGAVYIYYGNYRFTDSSCTGNNASYGGGAFYINGGNASFIKNSFNANNGTCGGAFYFEKGYGNFISTIFTDNYAGFSGGAIFVNDSTGLIVLNITKSVFKLNFGNIVYKKSIDNIFVDDDTKSLSDLDLIRKYAHLAVEVNNYTYGTTGSIICNVTSFDETVVMDGLVYMIINNKTYVGNIINGSGNIEFTDLNAGNYTVSIIYNGSSTFAKTMLQSVNFTVDKATTTITAKDATFIVNYDGDYKVIFNPIVPGVEVSFTLKGQKIGSVITDKSGVIHLKLTATRLKKVGAGTRNLIVHFAGNDNYKNLKVTAKITINRETTKFINVKSVKKYYKSTAKTMQLTSTLKNSKNKILKNQIVYFKVNNKKTYKVKTNSKGVAKLTLNLNMIKKCKINKKGKYAFTVTYKTSKTYKNATKKGTLIVVK